MDKTKAVNYCKSLLADGIYAMPQKQFLYDRWDIRINHPMDTIILPCGSKFIDCVFYRWEGYKTIDFPLITIDMGVVS
jgi:hypothetical protein